jgi:hypothetical protein
METDSTDGGATFGAPYLVTNDPGQDYNAIITYDSYHQQYLLTVSKWHNNIGGNGNDVVLMKRSTPTGQFGPQVVVQGSDGVQSYWEGQTIALNDGNLLTTYMVNGPESGQGKYSGYIASRTSYDNGNSFAPQQRISPTCNAEMPSAIENSNGTTIVYYSRYIEVGGSSGLQVGDTACADFSVNGYPQSDVHLAWSNDDGATWIGDGLLYHNPNNTSSLHVSVGVEAYQNAASCPTCKWDISFITGTSSSVSGPYGIFVISSTNQMATWTGPWQLPGSMTWDNFLNIMPQVTLTCTGAMWNYSDAYPGQNVYGLRYVASGCTGS